MRGRVWVLAVYTALGAGCSGGGGGGATPPSNPVPPSGTSNINVAPTAVDFGSVGIGANAAQSVTVSNSGTAALTLGSITAPAAPFTRTGGSCSNGQILAAGASCTIDLQFAPTAAGAANGNFSVPSDDADVGTGNGQNNVQVTLTGSGTSANVANINVNPMAVGFGTVTVGSTANQTVTVSNSGNADLTLGTITAPTAPFSRTGGTCSNGAVLASGNSCTMILQFAPTAAGAANGSFNVPSNDPDAGSGNGQNNVLVSLTGSGAAAQATSYHYYTGVPSGSSAVGGLFGVSSAAPATPVTVDANALASDNGSPNASRNIRVETGTMSASGLVSDKRTYAVVFAAAGRFYKQLADQAPAPVQITNFTSIGAGLGNGAAGSTATDLCWIAAFPDYANPENSVVIFNLSGADATCDSGDETDSWFRLSTTSSTAPVALAGFYPYAPVYSSSGAITGFLAYDLSNGTLVRVDANLGTPVTIAGLPNGGYPWGYLSPTRTLWVVDGAGSVGELRIVDATTNAMSGVLGTITDRNSAGGYSIAYDNSHVYFVDRSTAGSAGIVRRFPVDGSATATDFHNAGAVEVQTLALTPNAVVYATQGVGIASIAAVPKAGGAAVGLVSSNSSSLHFRGVSDSGYVYYDRWSGTFSANRAEAVRDDGTGTVVYGAANGAGWLGWNFSTTGWPGFTTGGFVIQYLDQPVVAEYAAGSGNIGGATLSVVDGSSAAKNGIVLGTVPSGMSSVFVFAEGRRWIGTGSDGDEEILFADHAVAGSLTRVTDDGVEQQLVY